MSTTRNVEDAYPLSPMQEGMLFHSLRDTDAGLYVSQNVYEIKNLDTDAFERAFREVIHRHPVLRTAFVWATGDRPIQVVGRKVGLPLLREDWSGISLEQRKEKLEDFLQSDRREGFKMAKAPLMRLALIRWSGENYRFVWTHHHILMDGWSVPLVLKEVLAFYRSFSARGELRLARSRPYRDYVAWLQEQDLGKAERFWRDQLRGFSEPTSLRVDLAPDPEGGAGRILEEGVAWSSDETEKLRAFAKRHRLTLNTLIQGAWAMLLSRYSGRDDVLFGAVVSGRPPELRGVESIVGLFINTLPVRLQLGPRDPALTWLGQLQEQQMALQEYEYSPLAEIRRWSEIEKGRSLFETILVVENYPVDKTIFEEAGNLEIERLCATERPDTPLTLIANVADRLKLRFLFDGHRFERIPVRCMARQMKTWIEALVAEPERRLADVPFLDRAEQHRSLVESNDVPVVDISGGCIHDLVEAQAKRTPEAVAVVSGSRALTHAELDRRANLLAHELYAEGVGPDERVGILADRSIEMLVALLGVMKAGGAYVPLDPAYPSQRLSFMLEDSRVRVLLSQRAHSTLLPEHLTKTLFLEPSARTCAETVREPPRSGVCGENLAYLIYTSGSTGQPKGVAIQHSSAVVFLEWARRVFGPKDLAGVLAATSICFDLSIFELFTPLSSGGSVLLAENALELPELPAAQRLSLINTVPSAMAELARTGSVPPCVRVVNLAGEPLPLPLAERLYEEPGIDAVFNLYGPSEDTTYSTVEQVPRGSGRAPAIGRPVSRTRAYLVDRQLRPTPMGVPGELYLAGDGLARGYFRRPRMTAERFAANPLGQRPGERWYRTGDLARYRPDGKLEYLGRVDHQVKVRGFRIELGEVEAALTEHPAVSEAVAVAREDEPGRKRLTAYVVPVGEEAAQSHELRRFLRQRLPEYAVPSFFVDLEALPHLPNGKVDRRALPAPSGSRTGRQKSFVAPRTSVEKRLAATWSTVLGRDRIGMDDDFFELGGDSILSIQVVVRAARAGVRITPKQIFQHPTLAELAAAAGTEQEIEAEQGLVTGTLPLTPVQHFFFQTPRPAPHHWNQSMLLEPKRPLDVSSLERVVRRLAVQHDALRLRFVRHGSGWRQSLCGPDEKVRLSVVDLSGFSADEDTEVFEKAATRVQASLDLEHGPVVRFVLFRSRHRTADRLLIVVHHLAVDGVSWRILLEDLALAYEQRSRGEAIRLAAKTTSFKSWAERLEAHASSREARVELPHWQSAALASRSLALPVDRAAGRERNIEAAARNLSVSLEPEETRALLQEVPKAYRTQINDVLLCALAEALSEWTGEPRVRVDLEGHGREDILDRVDLSRTVGWFTAIFPVLLDLQGASGPGERLKSVKEQLRGIPGRGVGYGLLRYLSGDEKVAEELSSTAEVSFNYLGQVDHALPPESPFALSWGSRGSARDAAGPRDYLLDVSGIVAEGRLTLSIRYGEEVHRRSTIEDLAQGCLRSLRSLLAHCLDAEAGGYTPSDFPLARLRQAELDRWFAKDRQVEDVYPLSPIQLGMLLHALQSPRTGVYVEQFSCSVRGELNRPALERAWEEVTRRHPILRTSFVWEGLDQPLQVVRRHLKSSLEVLSWEELPVHQQEERFTEFLRADKSRGFDLSAAPLVRWTLIAWGEGHHKLIWTTHHLIIDGWSNALLVQELFTLYESFLDRRESGLKPARPFRDYIAWLEDRDPSAGEEYWRRELAGFATPTPLRVDRQTGHPEGTQKRYGDYKIRLSRKSTEALESLAKTHRLTLNTFAQGALGVLLSRYSGERDVVFGITVSGRPAALRDVDSMIGPFINTLPVRLHIPREETMVPWLEQIRARQVEQQEYEHTPAVQRLGEVPLGTPLFETLLVFENYPRSFRDRDGESAFEIGDVRTHVRTRYPLNVVVTPGSRLELYFAYDLSRFDPSTVERMAEHLHNLLESMAGFASRRIDELPLSPAEERRAWSAGQREEILGELIRQRRVQERDPFLAELRSPALTQIYLLDRESRIVPWGVPGEVCAARILEGTPGSETPPAGLWHSGLLARCRQDGRLEWLGGLGDEITIRGRVVYPKEIETLLVQHFGVREAVVLDLAGQSEPHLVAGVVPAPGQVLSASEIHAFLAERMPSYLVPRSVAVEHELPRTPDAQVDAEALERAAQDPSRQRRKAHTQLEEVLLGIWSEVLGIETLRPDDHFFELGGHSLMATQLVSRLRRTLGVELSLAQLFEAPTITELTPHVQAALRGTGSCQAPPIEPGRRTSRLPLSFAQQRLWFLDQLRPGDPSYNVHAAVQLEGKLEAPILERTLDEIRRRHEILRTTFAQQGGRPVQRIAPHRRWELPRVDLSGLDEDRRSREARRLARREALRSFDLVRGPLLRVFLLDLKAGRQILLFNTHHIVSDAWSMGILLHEVATLYRAFAAGRPSPLPELEIQYADFSSWQRRWLAGDVLEAQLEYWQRHLGSEPPLLELPTDRPRSAVAQRQGARRVQALPSALSKAVFELGRSEAATPYMTLLAAFALLLSRLARQEEVVVGMPIANRNYLATEGLIGYFINILPLKVDLSGNPSFRELLHRVREAALGAFAHQDLPLEKLVEALRVKRHLDEAPLFRVTFGVQNTPRDTAEIPDLKLTPMGLDQETVRFDLTLWVFESEDGFRAAWSFLADLFDEATIARWQGRFEALLSSVLENPDAEIGTFEMLSEVEKEFRALEEEHRLESKRQRLFKVKPRSIKIANPSIPTQKKETHHEQPVLV